MDNLLECNHASFQPDHKTPAIILELKSSIICKNKIHMMDFKEVSNSGVVGYSHPQRSETFF